MVDINRFHTGVPYVKLRPDEYQADCYINGKYYYVLIEGYESTIQNDGTLTTTKGRDWPEFGIDEAYLYQLIDEAYGHGGIPSVEFIFTNVLDHTLTQSQVNNFIARLKTHLAGRDMVLDIMREWNRAGPDHLVVNDSLLNQYFAFFRNAIDAQGLKGQVLLSSHPVLPPRPELITPTTPLDWWFTSPDGSDVREGQRLCDMHGLSCYTANPRWSMELARQYRRWLGTTKPIMFCEWGPALDPGGELPEERRANAQFIESCYSPLPEFPEVKMLGWWYPILYKTYDGGAACAKFKEMSFKWDGYTPTPRILSTITPLTVGLILLWLGLR